MGGAASAPQNPIHRATTRSAPDVTAIAEVPGGLGRSLLELRSPSAAITVAPTSGVSGSPTLGGRSCSG
ncbi:hypothetical protein CCP4SC76_7870006 [Gammaproteobacteria bacterium]